jgi:uncharacterized protein
MRKSDVIIFFSTVFSIYGLINAYIFVRGWEALPGNSHVHLIYVVVFLTLVLSFIAGRFLERVVLSSLSSTLVWIGSFWLAGMVYLLLMVAALDILRFINLLLPFFPAFTPPQEIEAKQIIALVMVGSVVVIVAAGHINARSPRFKILDLTIPKNSQPMKTLNIVAVSDIHLGTIICRARLEKIVEMMNGLEPDLVLLPGDVVDEDIGPVIKQNLGETLRKIKSRYGVIGITGNHEYIGGVDEACRYLVDHGVTMLRDQTVRINESIYVVGREDRTLNRTGGKKRKSLEELMASVERSLPVILLDHQPFRLEEAEAQGIDLQVSGHTHHGQLWPFNFITKRVYELSWGYKRKGTTHIYVSCGVGTWGPPVRTGNRPEIVNIRLTFV